MQVTVERTGGFAGIALSKTVDSLALPQPEANLLLQMLAAANFFELPENIPSTPQPDRFSYLITASEAGKQHSVTVSEATMPDPLKPLLNWLMAQPIADSTHC